VLHTVSGHFHIIVNRPHMATDVLGKGLDRLDIVISLFREHFGRFNVPIHKVHNLQVPRHHRQTFFFRERVQTQNRVFDLRASRQPLQKLLCAMISREGYDEWSDPLIRLSTIALVESARMESNCAIIFPSNSVNSFVSGIAV
jgi:hypothetical protein